MARGASTHKIRIPAVLMAGIVEEQKEIM